MFDVDVNTETFTVKLTVSAVVIYQNDLFQQVLWSVCDDTSYCPFNDRKSLVYVEQHHADGWKVLGIFFCQTSEWCEMK